MSPLADGATHSRLFAVYLKHLNTAVSSLHQQRTTSIARRIKIWKSTWTNAYDGRFDIRPADLLLYGTLLGRLAEAYSFHSVVEEVLNRLAESAVGRELWIPHPASVLITAGESDRRRGKLGHAESRYNEAVKILEHDLVAKESRQQIHRELGRLFYELAYLHRLRGDAGATRSTLERSEAECDLAKDELGAEIARTVLGVVSYEEGFADAAVRALTERLSRLEGLVDHSEIKEAGRTDLVHRWLINARIHLGQAHLAAGNYATARQLIGPRVNGEHNPSIVGLATVKRIEAQLCLAEGDLRLARDAIGASWEAIGQQGQLLSTELAAATVAIAGVIHSLEGSRPSALSCFDEACRLPPDLHNRRAQGWAWAGRAILAREAGDRVHFLAAVHEGLAVIQRCGAPVRAFLLELLKQLLHGRWAQI
jgi:tetratricopeptide (TPR) repeat protein